MTKAERAALIYGLSAAGAAAVSYARGKRGLQEIGTDALLHGAVVGTGVNVVLWLRDDANQYVAAPTAQLALPNSGSQESCPYTGNVVSDGIRILSQINPDTLYKAAKLGSVLISPVGDDPNIVVLPEK